MSVDRGPILDTVVGGRTSPAPASLPNGAGSAVEQQLARRVLVVASTEAIQADADRAATRGCLFQSDLARRPDLLHRVCRIGSPEQRKLRAKVRDENEARMIQVAPASGTTLESPCNRIRTAS